MKFFFPDSQDQIDPSFDFCTEEHPVLRVRQRDDLYAHEALSGPVIRRPAGVQGNRGRYAPAERQVHRSPSGNRLYRDGVRRFFRLDSTPGPGDADHGRLRRLQLRTRGSPARTRQIRSSTSMTQCGFDLGISVDHVIFGFDPAADHRPDHPQASTWLARQQTHP